jgi:hypothetical protein
MRAATDRGSPGFRRWQRGVRAIRLLNCAAYLYA